MNVLTLKQVLQNDMDQDKELTFPITGKTMSIDLTKIKSKFIKSFMCSFKEHPMCLTHSKVHIDMMMDEEDSQDAEFLRVGYVSPWENLQPMFNEPAPWDTIIPEGREQEFLDLFIEETLTLVKQQNGM